MKKIFLSLWFLASSYLLFAQQGAPVIDSTWMPKVGDKYYTYTLTADGLGNYPLIPANDTGANFVWDFDSVFYLASDKPADSFDFVLPAMRNIRCLNPLANFATGDSLHYTCFIKDSLGVHYADARRGNGASDSYIYYYDKPLTFMKSNFRFRQQFNEISSQSSNLAVNFGNDSNHHEKDIIKKVYIGYGTLKVAGRVFDSAVRIRETALATDSSYTGSSGYSKYYVAASNDYWFVHNIHAPVFFVSRSWFLNSPGDTDKSLPGGVGIETLTLPVTDTLSLGIAPPDHPFTNVTVNIADGYIDVHNANEDGITYAVYDAEGRLITEGKPGSGVDNWQIPVSGLSTGVYILKLQNGKGQMTSIKLVKDQ